jgi:kynurenine formamidase
MPQRWKNRPTPSTWGDFGRDDQHGRMNLITPERRLRAMQEVREGRSFCLSLPLDLPGGKVLHPTRVAPVFQPIQRSGFLHFHLRLECTDPRLTDVSSDEGMLMYNQFSTHWDGFAHKGSMFDANGDGTPEPVFYNGFDTVDPVSGQGSQGSLGSTNLSIAEMAETCVQGRGVLIDLHRHVGNERVEVGYDMLSKIMKTDGVVVEEGDILLLHTGIGKMIMDGGEKGPDPAIRTACAVLDGSDPQLLNWVTQSGLVAIAADNLAVERSSTLAKTFEGCHRGPASPLHEHCLFKLGVHLGELWYLTELAAWLHEHKRSRVFLTAPPLRLPGAAGAPLTPVATV